MRKILLWIVGILSAAAVVQATELELENADFESGVESFPNGFDSVPDVPGWQDGEQITDAGTENSDAWWGTYDGTSAFMKMGDSAFLLSDYTIQTGDEFTIGFAGKSWDGASQWTATLFYDDPGNVIGSYAADVTDVWIVYSNATPITATAESVGGTLGILFENTGSGFANLDNVVIDQQSPVGPATITLQPASQTIEEGRPVTFKISCYGTLPVAVQWYCDSAPIAGATNTAYTIDETVLADDGSVFYAVVANEYESDAYSDTSDSATLTVMADTTAPVLERVYSEFPDGVLVQFSERVDEATATDIANYSITYNGGSLAVTAAELTADPSVVLLGTAVQVLETAYTLHVSNVEDISSAGNAIAADSQSVFIASEYITGAVGDPSTESSVSWVEGGLDITAAGSGVGDTSDQFSFSYETYSGDFDVQVRVSGMEFSDAWARAGLMARDGLESNALFAAMFTTPGPVGCHFMARAAEGDDAVSEGYFPTTVPDMWLRLRRTGDLFEGFAGIDGSTWEPIGSESISMSTELEVGFVVSSADSTNAVTVGFRDASEGTGTVVSSLALPFEPLGPSSRRGAMVISEIMVDPRAEWEGTNNLEFVEIYNTGLITEDLSGHRFSGEIDYTFPDGTTLAPGEFLVIANEPDAASAYYGVSCLGPYDGKLSNSGGRLRLRNEIGGILLEVEYNDKAPWPVAVFGTGHSMVLSHPSYGENDARAWSASDRIGGSPGTFDGYGAEPARGVVINEYLAHTDLPQVDYVELFNTGSSAVDLSGAWLSDDASTNKYRIADGTVIPAHGFRSFDQTELGFALSADGEEIYLVNSNQTRVIDAVVFRGQANGISEGRYPDGAPGFQELDSVTKGSANDAPLLRDVVINEIMYHPVSDSDDDEYIELYNRSGSTIDLSNWKLQGGISYQFPDGAAIPAHGYVVVAENVTNLMANYSPLTTANTFGNYGGKLGDGGDTVRLSIPEDLISTNETGLVVTNIFYIPVDEVTYLDGGRWGEWSDGGGSSLELIDPDADNRQPASWADSDETEKAAWTTVDVTNILENGQSYVDEGTAYGTASDCNRLELFLQGAGEALVDDVEFLNNGGSSLVQNGDFSSSSDYWGFGGVVRDSYVEDGALHLVSVARGDTGCNKAYNDLSYVPSITGADTGTIRAQVRWQKGTQYMLLRLRGNWMEVPVKLNVPTNCGTPGQANSQKASNAGPAVYDVGHFPVLPEDGADVVVTARAVDPDGISAMTLYYRVDPSTTYSSVAMSAGGAGLYSATIPGQSADTLAAFYVSASDGSVSSTFPEDVPERECLVRWGEAQFAGSLGTYRLWVTAATASEWYYREKNANDTLDGTFVYGNSRVVYNVDTMYSASPFHTPSYNGPAGSFACDYEVNFHAGERFLGSEPFVLSAEENSSNFWYDNTSQNDITAMWIARKLGQQYNYRRHVHMIFNGQERGDVYLDTQQPNSDMLDEYYPDDSQEELRKIESWFEFADDFSSQGTIYSRISAVEDSSGALDTTWYRWLWRPRATSNPENWFSLTNLIAAVNDTTAPDREARVRAWMDVPGFFRPIAAHHICGNWDSYAYSRGKNMYAYKPDGKGWKLLMWDAEISFAKGDSAYGDNIYTSVDSSLFNMMQAVPAIHREYLMAYQEAVDSILLPNVADPILDERYDNLIANGISISSPDTIKSYIAARRTTLQGILPTASFAAYAAATVSSNSVTISGTSPLTVSEILINGMPYDVEWTSTTGWNVSVPLSAGLNSLIITGVDRFGDAVDGASDTVSVTYPGADPVPDGVVVLNEIHPSPEDRDLQFLELYNTSLTNSFDLSGWRINGLGYTFDDGDVIGPGEYLLLVDDLFRFTARYPDAVVFDDYAGSLDPDGETLTLLRPVGTNGVEDVVDRVRYEGHSPWAASTGGSSLQLIDAAQDNARVANWTSTVDAEAPAAVSVISIEDEWNYYQSGDPGTGWELPMFDDSAWPTGAALLYNETSSLPAAKNTELTLGESTYYFRKTFSYSGSTSDITLDLSTVLDDGVILYLNGTEILRVRLTDGEVTHETYTETYVGDAAYEYFTIPTDALVQGENVIAAEVHQQSATSSDVVFGMTLDIEAGASEAVTPGRANSVAGAVNAFPDLWLNELQASNGSGAQDNAGDRDPWVELYNAGTSEISLDGYYLTDDYSVSAGWAFPAGTTIAAGKALVVWCDGETNETAAGYPHADFVLPVSSGRVGLARTVGVGVQLFDYLTYTNLPSNYSYGDVPDGQPFYRREMFYASPGATNNGASAPLTVSVNEWMADNDGTLSDPADSDYDDWFELYNPGTNTIDLGGYYLTDDLSDPFLFEVPDNGHYTIVPGGYLLVWADGEPGQNSTNLVDLHADFKLGKDGESIGIFAADGTVIDSVTFGAQITDESEGRYPDGAAGIFTMAEPTPRAANLVENTAPVLDAISDVTLTLGQTLAFYAGATDYDVPLQSLGFSLTNAPAGASIDASSGAFSWTPPAVTTNTLAVVVTDSGAPAMSAAQWFTVVVVPPPVPGDLTTSGTNVSFSWSTVSGQPYRIYYKDELPEVYWNPLSEIIFGTGGTLFFTNSLNESPQRFYRIGVE